ncbi:MAG TPA: hypothetical protein VMS14_01725 [Ilumatobacteraceae bacterium]|nr:hypothetical protein [Ilumatobacteraceae bacterium]HUC32089.1 hypothetical protein [Ilumatobacteraceae bacterium]
MKDRIDRFPTQLVLTMVWIVVGLPLSIHWGQELLWTQMMSLYAIVVTHFSAHLAWRAKRVAQETEEMALDDRANLVTATGEGAAVAP